VRSRCALRVGEGSANAPRGASVEVDIGGIDLAGEYGQEQFTRSARSAMLPNGNAGKLRFASG
jgi:hypothetical protein